MHAFQWTVRVAETKEHRNENRMCKCSVHNCQILMITFNTTLCGSKFTLQSAFKFFAYKLSGAHTEASKFISCDFEIEKWKRLRQRKINDTAS